MSKKEQYTGPLAGDIKPVEVAPDGLLTYGSETADLRTVAGQKLALEIFGRPFWRTKEAALQELTKTLAKLDPPQLLLV